AAGQPSRPLDLLDPRLERHNLAEAHALDGRARWRRDAARIREHARQEAVAAGGKVDCSGHILLPSANLALARVTSRRSAAPACCLMQSSISFPRQPAA